MKLTETVPPLSSFNSQVTFEQESILRRALAVYPEERYPSTLAFADALIATLISPSQEVPHADLASQPEPAPEFERIPQTEPALISELELQPLEQKIEPVLQAEPQFPAISEPEPEPEPALRFETRATLEFVDIPHTEPPLASEIDLEQQPQPQPAPEPAPEPLPQPTPVPLPQTAPETLPEPAPEPLPEPTPEPLPQPAPDVYQPVPQPATEPASTPQPETPVASGSSAHQEALEVPATQPTISPRLIISSPGTAEPYEFVLEREETTIGRAGSDDVLLEQDASTSRHHALLKHENDHYVLYDQRSANGVFVNGQKLADETGFTLADGDQISIGNYELLFHCKMPQASNKPEEALSDIATPLSS